MEINPEIFEQESNSKESPSRDNQETSEACLICSTLSVSSSVAPRIPSGLNLETSINEHLWPMFLLRRVLQFPQKECQNLLHVTRGLNPISWFKICDKCIEIVNQAFVLHGEILQLEGKLNVLRKQLAEEMVTSLDSSNLGEELLQNQEENIVSARKLIRNYFKNGGVQEDLEVTRKLPRLLSSYNNSDVLRAYRANATNVHENPNLYPRIRTRLVIEKQVRRRKPNGKIKFEHILENMELKTITKRIKIIKKLKPTSHYSSGTEFKTGKNLLRQSEMKGSPRHTSFDDTYDEDFKEEIKSEQSRLLCTVPGCGLDFAQKKGLQRHIKRLHSETAIPSGENKMKCHHCPLRFNNIREVQHHMREKHDEIFKFKCKQCDAKYVKYDKLRLHRESNHSGIKLPCPKCRSEFRSKLYLRRHLASTSCSND